MMDENRSSSQFCNALTAAAISLGIPAEQHQQQLHEYLKYGLDVAKHMQDTPLVDSEDILEIDPSDIYEGFDAYMAAKKEKANEPFQAIISLINRARREIENVTESDVTSYLCKLMDDLEGLSKEQCK